MERDQNWSRYMGFLLAETGTEHHERQLRVAYGVNGAAMAVYFGSRLPPTRAPVAWQNKVSRWFILSSIAPGYAVSTEKF